MLRSFESPGLDVLLQEQEEVQATKFQGRLLTEYDSLIFPTQHWNEPRSSAVTDFVRPLCWNDEISLSGLIRGMYAANDLHPIHWADMGGGRGLAMRQVSSEPTTRGMTVNTNVDLFEYGLTGLTDDEMSYLQSIEPTMLNNQASPILLLSDVETVELPEPANLLTSVETMQYLNNPMQALANWYNQLADNGLMIISAERDWSSWIRYPYEQMTNDPEASPTKAFLDALGTTGIAFAAMNETDTRGGLRGDLDPSQFRNLVVQKQSDTQMRVNSEVADVWVNPYDFKAVYYNKPGANSPPLVEVENLNKADKSA